jgi:hypothetical protein
VDYVPGDSICALADALGPFSRILLILTVALGIALANTMHLQFEGPMLVRAPLLFVSAVCQEGRGI